MNILRDGLLLLKRALYPSLIFCFVFIISAAYIVNSQKPTVVETTTLASITPYPSGTTIEQADAYSERLKKIDSLVQYFSQRQIQQNVLNNIKDVVLPENIVISFSANATAGVVVVRVEGPLNQQRKVEVLSKEIVDVFLATNTQIESDNQAPSAETLNFRNDNGSLTVIGQVSNSIWFGAIFLGIFTGISATLLLDIFRRRLLYFFQRDSFSEKYSIPAKYLGSNGLKGEESNFDEIRALWAGSYSSEESTDLLVSTDIDSLVLKGFLDELMETLEIRGAKKVIYSISDHKSSLQFDNGNPTSTQGSSKELLKTNYEASILVMKSNLDSFIEISKFKSKAIWIEVIDSVKTTQYELERKITLWNRLGTCPDMFIYL